MQRVVKRTIRVNVELEDDLARYDEVLNDPLARIVETREVKVTDKQYGDEGGLIAQKDSVILIVTYETKQFR